MNAVPTREQVILAVDDDALTRQLHHDTLTEMGFRVEAVASGREAVAFFRESRVDLVLLDVHMPDMDGFETCAAIRRLPGGDNVPIVILTGDDDAAITQRAYDVGATDFESKLVPRVALVQRLRHLLRAQRTVDDLRESELRLAAAQRLARIGSWQWDFATEQHTWSDQTFRLLGYSPEDCVPSDQAFLARVHSADRERVQQAMQTARREGEPYTVEYRVVRLDGEELIIQQRGEVQMGRDRTPRGLAGTVQDITERRRAEDQIRQLAYFDPTTGLPNRTMFLDRLQQALSTARRHKNSVALFFMDLDQFKRVNDTLGHAVGDELLREASKRLGDIIRNTDTVVRPEPDEHGKLLARLGGDEFVVLLADIDREDDIATIAERMLAAFHLPFLLGGREAFATLSIGISVFPRDATDTGTLLSHADAAMYAAKDAGRANYRFFDATLNAMAQRRHELEGRLRRSVERQEFEIHYQPIVDGVTATIVGAECLVRWRDPDMGLITPDQFISVAEESSLIVTLSEWIMRTVCRQQRQWTEQGLFPMLSVNVVGLQIREGGVASRMEHIIAETGADPTRLTIELTERVILNEPEHSIRVINRLKEHGIKISLDDFGTGYSSLSYLRQIPVDHVKVDKAFVSDLGHDESAAALTEVIAILARRFGLEPIAEGVETPQQRDTLLQQGYRLMQGYFFSRPIPAAEFTTMLRGAGSLAAR